MNLLRDQRVEVQLEAGSVQAALRVPAPLSRAERAHSRLSWQERFARNGRGSGSPQITIKLFGVPHAFVLWLGLRGGESGNMIPSPSNEGK